MRALVIAVVLMVAGPAFAQRVLAPSDFRDAVVAMIRTQTPGAEIELRDDLGITVRNAGNKDIPEFQVNFDNAYAEYQANPGALTEIVDRWARFATETPEHSRMAERVVAVVRSRAAVEAMMAEATRAAQDEAAMRLIWRPLAGDLVQVLVFDGAETIQYATPEALTDLGLSIEDAWASTPENLPQRLGPLEVGGVEGADRLIYITGGNGLAPSALLEGGGFCASGMEQYLFLVVERNGFIAGDRNDALAYTQFRQLVEDVRVAGDTMSITPLGCHQGRIAEIMLTD